MLDAAGLIVFTSNGTPRLKRYLHANPGQVPPDVWTDIPPVNSQAKERVGHPTQKPLALLELIIKASCNEGDVVLDPFCGCATAWVAAARLGRQWVGIDLSPLAAQLVEMRMHREGTLLFKAVRRDDVPRRTDVGELPNYRTHKHTLYGRQEGICAGCRTLFPFPPTGQSITSWRERGAAHGPPRQPSAAVQRLQFHQGHTVSGGIPGQAARRRHTDGLDISAYKERNT